MKTIEIKAKNTASLFNILKDEIGGSLNIKLKEYELVFNNDFGKGMVRGMKVANNITFLQFDATFNEDISLSIESPQSAIINFLYCNEGKLSHSFGLDQSKSTLETFQTGISTNINTNKNTIYFYKDSTINSVLISVNTLLGKKKEYNINTMLFNTFIKDKEVDHLYLGSYNLKITDYIKQLDAVKQEGVVRMLLIEGMVNLILASEVEQHKQDSESNNLVTGTLTVSEMKDVRDLSEYIQNYPETNLGVDEWCAKIGLSPAKVQEGFKLIHGKTINEYIRYVRVKKSEELIKTTDLNISEIVYTLGLSSRSYFSHIFKDMYNCSPSEYKKKNRLAATA